MLGTPPWDGAPPGGGGFFSAALMISSLREEKEDGVSSGDQGRENKHIQNNKENRSEMLFLKRRRTRED